MKYTKTFLILTALFGGLQSSLTYADHTESSKEQKMTMESKQEQQIIYLAGGCFWGLEAYMERIQGVTDAVSGYANGKGDTTSYQLLHATDHAETVKVTYDPNKISLDKLLQYYFRVIDPTSINKQGNDRGRQYRTGIYYQNEQDKAVIEAALKNLQSKYQEPIQIEVEPLKNYVEAEEYHQDYLKKNPNGYCHIDIKKADEPLIDDKKYPKPSDAELKQKLTALCREREGITTGQILEYFRDTEFSKPLEILASWDHLLDDLEIINAFSQNYRRLNIQAIERDIEMLIAKERAEGLTDQERAILVNLLKGKEEQKKQLVNPS